MVINANTKIGAILKKYPEALETIISISPKFDKLRNPLLRKLIANRTSISMAAKIGGCSVQDFFSKLKSLGLEIDENVAAEEGGEQMPTPDFIKNAKPGTLTELDVRPVIDAGQDPFQLIIQSVKKLPSGGILKLINSFEPTPLIPILSKQGLEHYVQHVDENLVHTYFFKSGDHIIEEPSKVENSSDWLVKVDAFKDRLVTVDVRQLEAPLPMHTILGELDDLPADKALYVYHKRIPVFLLPELADRGFEYRINEISDGEVHLLIYKD